MSISITCYGSAGEIGGNKILLEDGETRLMLDFGTSFGRLGNYFNEFLRPRAVRGLQDPLLLELIPPLEGLYRPDLEAPGLWSRLKNHPAYRSLKRGDSTPAVDAVLLSHAHLDHNGDISYLDERIPIYTTRLSAFIARSMQVTGSTTMEREMVYTSPRASDEYGDLSTDKTAGAAYHLRPHAFLDGALSEDATTFWMTAGEGARKKIDPAPAEKAPDNIQGLEIRWWPVDHSIPGAASFAIHTSAGWVGYTGDIRFHGKHGPQTERFMHELAELKPVALFCEGTHTDPEEKARLSEAEIFDRALPILQQYAGRLAVADFGPRNLERLFVFLDLAEHSRRTLLVQPKDIYLLQAMHLADPPGTPHPDQTPRLAMYADPKAAPRGWEKGLRETWKGTLRGPADVSKSPGDFILAFSLFDLNDLTDLTGIAGGVFLFSNSRAYDDEQAADLDRLRNWVQWAGLALCGDPDDPHAIPLHASGHASGTELVRFVKTVQPKTLIPIHTEVPAWWVDQLKGTSTAIRIPEYAKTIRL